MSYGTRWVVCSMVLAVAGAVRAEAPDLARYFGWGEPRFIVLDDGAGPVAAADMNGDGLADLICVNNSKSRIEVHVQRAEARTPSDVERDYKVNELPPSPYYDRKVISVSHRVSAFRIFDVDQDGLQDVVYAGDGSEVVVLRQTKALEFDTLSKRRVKDLQAGQDGMEIADVMGDARPELLLTVGGRIEVYALSSRGAEGQPLALGSGATQEQIVAFFVEDFNGDGLSDIMAAIPDDAAPIRIWLQEVVSGSGAGKQGQVGPERRFESPALRELEPVRFPDRAAASIAVIERSTRRIVLSDLKVSEGAEVESRAEADGGERDASFEAFAYSGAENKARSSLSVDVDGDGLLDFLVNDQKGNSLILRRQSRGVGLGAEERFSALKDPTSIAAGQWDSDGPLEVFVMSEADKVVGVSEFDASTGRLSFPDPLPILTAGASPVAMGYVGLKTGPSLAVVVRDKRDHTLEVHRPGGASIMSVKLEGVTRPPAALRSGDFDHDGSTDVLLFTPGEPLVMVSALDGGEGAAKVLTDKQMPQFGLVQAAGPQNTASFDINQDGYDELLVADQNFVRACEFVPGKGWRVVEQITLPEASAALTTLTVLGNEGMGSPTIIAYDKANKRLTLMVRSNENEWIVRSRLRFPAFDVSSLFAGSFGGDGRVGILATSDSAFATVQLAGATYTLDEISAYRHDTENRLEHELEFADLNSDGYIDAVCLEAREQMCQIFSVSKARKLTFATEFEVFESRLFSRGEGREYEPSAAVVSDVTGDGLADVTLLVHDRLIVYPQMGRN